MSIQRVLRAATAKAGLAIVLVAVFVVGYWLGRPSADERASPTASEAIEAAEAPQQWTCSMHPEIIRSAPGNCPKCGMELVPMKRDAPVTQKEPPKYACSMMCVPPLPRPGKCPICGMEMVEVKTEGGDDDAPRQLKLSPTAEKLADIQVARAERRFVEAEIRMVGKVEYDETRVAYITSWVPGRLDRLYVDYTGVPVKKGDKLVFVYSPELLSAQEELFQAKRAVKRLESSELPSMRETAKRTVDAVREKLRLWGLTAEQIAEIERRGTPSDHMTILAPMSGIVVHKNALEGMYVATGTRIYTIADLTQVWVKLDAYESDLSWVRYGQSVEFTTEAYPGETFVGKIAFEDPVLSGRTRTVKVRVNVPNSDGRLKPEMFVRGVVRSKIAAGGKVMDPSLAGKWISPKHPEIVRDEPGLCDICGAPLVRAETLGYVAADAAAAEAPLVIPAAAPLITGTRAVVYVKVPDKPGAYEGRVIQLGPRAGNHYTVRSGLEAGELVVVNGNFKIDSAIQIRAKPSMMNPEGGAPAGGHQHHGGAPGGESTGKRQAPAVFTRAGDAFRRELAPALDAYVDTHRALSKDDLAAAKSAAGKMASAIGAIDMRSLTGDAHERWMKESAGLTQSAGAVAAAADLSAAREAFSTLSDGAIAVVGTFGIAEGKLHQFRCSMAFDDRGANWLQEATETANPYYGDAMYACGERTATFAAGIAGPCKPQTVCPVMGNEIDREVFTDHEGQRVYFCCPPCIEKFNADPKKYLAKLAEQGVLPTATPADGR